MIRRESLAIMAASSFAPDDDGAWCRPALQASELATARASPVVACRILPPMSVQIKSLADARLTTAEARQR
jgi:hypothetical protein